MRTRTKKMLSLLLAAAMVFTMNSFAFADEIFETASVEDEGVVVADTTAASDASGNWNPTVSADKVLSENIARISDNLVNKSACRLGTSDYFIVYPTAIAWKGQKVGSKKHTIDGIEVWKKNTAYTAKTTLSSADLVSGNKMATSANVIFTKLDTKKIKIKAAKGATVGLDGKGLYPVAKSTYISSIKLSDKTENKNFQKAFKEVVKGVKKEKTKTVSDNEMTADGLSYALTIAVYPAYGGNDTEAINIAKLGGLNTLTVDTAKTKIDKKKIVGKVVDKKVTLKETKKAGKYKGIGKASTGTADSNSLKKTTYYELDGNFAGNYYY